MNPKLNLNHVTLTFSSAFFCALIIAITYTVTDPDESPLTNLTSELNETDTNRLSEIDTVALLALIDLPITGSEHVTFGAQ